MLVVTVDDVRQRRDALTAALSGGFDAIQLRDRRAAGGALLDAARELRVLTREHRAALIVNDRIDVARAASADGVQLPAASFSVAAARALLGPETWIGCSTHAPAEAVAAARAGADYVILGPIYATPSKAQYGEPLGLGAITATRIDVPLIAIGGVTRARAAELRTAGAAGFAVVREVFEASDAGAAARALVEAVAA
jgi:thiamine-phosphate pyrophosphorylase